LINSLVLKKEQEFLAVFARNICKSFKSRTSSIFSDSFKMNSRDFWSSLEQLFMTELENSLQEFEKLTKSFSNTDSFFKAKMDLEKELICIYREYLISETGKSVLSLRIGKLFDKNFRFDASGRPCHWDTLVAIDEAYDAAIQKVIFILIIFIYDYRLRF
jgi:hypothetical protein